MAPSRSPDTAMTTGSDEIISHGDYDHHEHEAVSTTSPRTAAVSFTPTPKNRCRKFEVLPTDRGIMITLNVPTDASASDEASCVPESAGRAEQKSDNGNDENDNDDSCTCLKLHPQTDANLPEFHPNIYIPSSLLDYPDQLVKYGGGGSGVTVFGGYHPLLGSLVMKHGGHKDLIELVSLAKIEREMGVRGQWQIDRLEKENENENSNNNEKISHTDHAVEGVDGDKGKHHHGHGNRRHKHRLGGHDKPKHDSDISHTDHPAIEGGRGEGEHHVHGRMRHHTFSGHAHANKQTADSDASSSHADHHSPKRRFTFHTAKPAADNTTDTRSHDNNNNQHHNTMHIKHHKSQPMLAAMEFVMRRMSSAFSFASAENLRAGFASAEDLTTKAPEEGDDANNNEGLAKKQLIDNERNEEMARALQMQAIQFATEDMKKRIPSFRMIYISPMHMRERKKELKNSTFHHSNSRGRSMSLGSVVMGELSSEKDILEERRLRRSSDSQLHVMDSKDTTTMNTTNTATCNDCEEKVILRRHSSVLRKGRQLHLFGSAHAKSSTINVWDDHVDLCFGGSYRCWKDTTEEGDDGNSTMRTKQNQHSCRSQADGSDGYATLMAFVEHLRRKQELNDWKITLGQKTIGQCDDGSGKKSAMTASSLLAQGKLHGPLLHHLIDNQIQVIRNLQVLTMPEELDVTERVRAEYESILSRQEGTDEKVRASQVSPVTNDFVGRAIHKNFHPISGRFVMLKQFGIDLRRGKIHLKPNEIMPAKHLENLFYREWDRAGLEVEGSCHQCDAGLMEETFDMHYHDPVSGNDASSHPIFAAGLDQWQSLLELSLSMKHPNATNRIWTCGLTDGGLHNMFLSKDQMWLFDLGEPNLEPIPAFLTKFLMSFLHTLGMEEDEKGDWIVRFEQDDSGKLRLTEQTLDILPKVMDAFNVTMDRIIAELFDGEEEIRVLLLRYVTTQLISDAAFCVEKWRIKGGGDEQRSEHQYFLQKWLWRALWDVFASEEIRRRYLTRMLFRRQDECRDLGSVDSLGSLME